MLKRMLRCAVLIAFAVLTCSAQEKKAPLVVTTRIGDLMAPGMKNTVHAGKGLPFAIELKPQSPENAAPKITLKGNNWTGPAILAFNDIRFNGRDLNAFMTLHNETGSTLDSAKLFITSVTERYRTKDAAGKETVASRTWGADMAAPIDFGSIPKAGNSGEYTLNVSGFHTTPETVHLTVNGVVAGPRFE
jgi:hypothetical protein